MPVAGLSIPTSFNPWVEAKMPAEQSSIALRRPFYQGPHSPTELASIVNAGPEDADWQIGNEPNLIGEGFGGDVHACMAHWLRVRAKTSRRLYLPPLSTGKDGWTDDLPALGEYADDAFGYVVHAYGTTWADLAGCVNAYRNVMPKGMPFIVGEFNAGSGQVFDREAWVHVADDFIAWLKTIPECRYALYFAWDWDFNQWLPTHINAKGYASLQEVIERHKDAVATPPAPEPPIVVQPSTGGSMFSLAHNPWAKKLLTVWNLPADPDTLIRTCAEYGFEGVEIKVCDGDSSWLGRRNVSREYVDRLRLAGLLVAGWGYHYCDGKTSANTRGTFDRGNGVWSDEAATALLAIKELALPAYTFDLEIECEGHAHEVESLLQAVRAQTQVPLAAHTWADLSGHDEYPAREIYANVDVIRVMCYEPVWNAADAWKSWADADLPLRAGHDCPVWGITDRGATADRISADMSFADEQAIPGEAFWELAGLPGRSGVADLIKSRGRYQSPAGPEPSDGPAPGSLDWYEANVFGPIWGAVQTWKTQVPGDAHAQLGIENIIGLLKRERFKV